MVKALIFALTISGLVQLCSINKANQYEFGLQSSNSENNMTTNEVIRQIGLDGNRIGLDVDRIKIREFLYQSIVIVSFFIAIFRNNKNIQLFLLVACNIFLALISVFYYNHHLQIINQGNLTFMMVISVVGYGILALLDYAITKLTTKGKQQKLSTHKSIAIIIRRKSFHIAPVLILPLLAFLNIRLLQIMLSGSFYILFNLQLLRFTQRLQYQSKNSQDSQLSPKQIFPNSNTLYEYYLKKYFDNVFIWMQQLNKSRESGFWYTHLYLYLTLILSYEIFPQDLMKQNIGLMLMLADGAAAIIGSQLGKIKIYGSKTLQGLCSFVTVMFLCQSALLYSKGLYYSQKDPLTPGQVYSQLQQQNQLSLFWVQIIGSSVLTGLCELFSGDLDNVLCIWTFILFDFITHSLRKIQ